MSLSIQKVFDFASTMQVMTLATFYRQETWTAPVYYIFSDKRFYFFSNPDSRHIREAFYSQQSQTSEDASGSKNKIAASVFLDDKDFKNIKGLQMQGRIIKVENRKEAILNSFEYVKKFKINYNNENIIEFFHDKYKAKLYKFIPDTLYYMDNSQGFGFRERFEL